MKCRYWFEIPGMRLRNPLNVRRHWRAVHKDGQGKKSAALILMLQAAPPAAVTKDCKRWVVTIMRRGPRKMDDDGLSASAKYVRDGIAKALGIDDGDKARLRFIYMQELAKTYSVMIEVQGF